MNGAYNFMGHADSASWIRALEHMQQVDVKLVAPGHGPLAGKELLEKQKRYFVELRQEVKKGITATGSMSISTGRPNMLWPWRQATRRR